MQKPGGQWRSLPVVAGGTALLIFILVAWTYLTDDSPQALERADQRASVGALAVAAVGLLVTVLTVHQSRRPPASEHRRLLADATAELAQLVSRQWSHEARIRGLAQPTALRVR